MVTTNQWKENIEGLSDSQLKEIISALETLRHWPLFRIYSQNTQAGVPIQMIKLLTESEFKSRQKSEVSDKTQLIKDALTHLRTHFNEPLSRVEFDSLHAAMNKLVEFLAC